MASDYRPARVGVALLGGGGLCGVALGICAIVALRHFHAALPAFLEAVADAHGTVYGQNLLPFDFSVALIAAGGTGLVAAVLAAILAWRPQPWTRIGIGIAGVGTWVWVLLAITQNITSAVPGVDHATDAVLRTQDNLLVSWYEMTVMWLGAGMLAAVTAGAVTLLFSRRADLWFHSREEVIPADPAWIEFLEKRRAEAVPVQR